MVLRTKVSLEVAGMFDSMQVPDSNRYEASSTRFEHDIDERLNWSELDMYVTLMALGMVDEAAEMANASRMKFWGLWCRRILFSTIIDYRHLQ